MARSKGVFSPPPGPRTADVFTDRDDARKVLRLFFEELLQRPFIASKPIKVFYGVGGAGKTALREKSISDFHTQMSDQGGYPLAFAQIDLDSDSFTPEYPIFDLFSRHLRIALKQAGCSLPLFDLYCLAWRARMAESASFDREEIKDYLGIHEKTVEVAGSFSTSFADLATSIKGVNLVLKAAIAFRDSRRAKRYAERFPNLELAEMTSADFEKNAHEVLASDLMDFLNMQCERNAHPYALCIVVDGFERIQSTVNARNSQWALQALCDRVATYEPRLRCGYVFFGRKKLQWRNLYDHRDDLPEDTWEALIEHHLVGGLSRADARFFLNQVQIWYKDRMEDAVCAEIHNILSSHGDAILTAAEEISTDQPEPVFHPFSLDLAIKQIGGHYYNFDVHRHLGRGHKDLQERFLRYMPVDLRKALQSLALALEFDETLFKILVNQHIIEGIPIQDFHDLVSPDNSHVLSIGNSYRLHSKMQEAFLADLQDQQNGQKKALTTIEILVSYYAEQLTQAVQSQATSAMLNAFIRASNILLAHAQSELLDTEVFRSSFFALDDSLPDGLLANARKSAWIRASAILTERFSEENEYALSARAEVAHWTGETGDAHAALALFQALLPIQQRVLGPEHPYTLMAHNDIAHLTGQTGDPRAALALFQALLPIQQRVLGPDHPDTLRTHNNLAGWTGHTGDAQAALALFQALLPIRERVLGLEHPDTLRTHNNIAHWTGQIGDARAALALFQALLPIQQRVLGPDHPDTLRTHHNIAGWTGQTGDPRAALALFQELLPIQQRVFGSDHPETLRTHNNIASLTSQTGDPRAALALFQEQLPIHQRVLGPEHPDTLMTHNNIASLTGETGDAHAALALYQALLPIQQRVLGPEHPETLTTYHNIAHWTGQTGDPRAALALFQALLSIQQRVLGLEHPDILMTHYNIAYWTGETGDAHATLALFQELLSIQQRVLGPEHPDTLRTHNNIAHWTGQTGDPRAALALFQALLPIRQRVLGPDHPATLSTHNNIAYWTGKTGDAQAALALYQALLPIQQRVLGPEHPDTLRTHNNLAHWTGETGQIHAALALYQALLPIRQRVLGLEHPDTLRTHNNLACWTGQTGEIHAALALFQELLPIQQRVLGPDHPDTCTTKDWIAYFER